jgi:hypothetical protein
VLKPQSIAGICARHASIPLQSAAYESAGKHAHVLRSTVVTAVLGGGCVTIPVGYVMLRHTGNQE